VKPGKTLLVAAFAVGLLAASASAAMYLDIDPSSGSGSATYAIGIDSGTWSYTGMKLNARIVSGESSNSLLKFFSKVVSTNVGGGLILGTLSDAWNTTELNLYGNASLGTQKNLDSDTDTDIGGADGATSTDWMLAQKSATGYVTQTDNTNGIPAYTVNFAGTGWVGGPGANPHGITVIQAVPRDKTGVTIWKEGTVNQGNAPAYAMASTGYTITLYRPDDAALDKAQIDLKLGSGTLDASGSIGSINKWLWDIGGEGTYEVTSATGTSMTFTYNKATGQVDWTDGVGDSGSYTPTAAEKKAGQVMVTMQTKYVNSSTLTHDETSAMVLLPEPATMALLGLGGLALAVRRRRVA